MSRASNSAAEDWIWLISGALGALWRWRLELILIGGVLLGWRLLARPLEPALAGVIVAVTVALALAPGVSRRAILRWLKAARVRRRWHRAWVDVGLPRVVAR